MQHDPGRIPALVFSVLAMAGLVASLFTPRRRVFVRVLSTEGGGARVEVAGLARGEDAGLAQEVDALARALGAGSSPEAPPDARARPGEELHRVGTGRAWSPSGRSEAAETSTRSTSTRTGVET